MNIIFTDRFFEDIKYYIRKKKYTKIWSDVQTVVDNLENGILIGDELEEIISDGKTYKVRIANSSAKVGKSNGFRLIYYLVTNDNDIYMLTIYSKKDDLRTLTDSEIRQLIRQYVLA